MKKIISVIAVVLMTVSLFALSVSATDTYSRGDEIQMTVTVQGQDKVIAGALELIYDDDVLEIASKTVLTFTNYKANWNFAMYSEFGDALFSIKNVDVPNKKATYALTNELKEEGGIEISGAIFDVTFKVKADAPYGSSTTVEADVQYEIAGSGEHIMEKVTLGTVTVACPHANTENVAEQPATCKDVGYTAGVYCNDCKTYISGHEEIAVLNTHSYGAWTKSSDTQHSRTCSVCKNTENENHTWNDGTVTTQPTHTTDGVKTYTCTVCSATKTEAVGKTTGHTFNQQVANDTYKATSATCTAKATYYYSCICGEKGTATFEYGEALGHSYGAWTKSSDTQHSRTCSVCKNTENENHTWNDGTVTTQPTHTTDGVKTYTCTVCSATKTEAVGKTTEHTFNQQVANDTYKATSATCTAKATYYYSCICGEKGTATFECGETLPHSFTVLQSNEETHWYKCASCDATSTPEAHSGTGTCTVCGRALGEPEPEIVASGECGAQGNNLTWTLDENGKLTISGTGKMAGYDYNSVPWSTYKNSLKTVVIGDSVTSIGYCAFTNCRSLASITFGENSQLTSIGNSAFESCTSLTSITIPDSVTSIGDNAFSNCVSLTSITLPDSVTSIGDNAFYSCVSLASITVDANNEYYSSEDGVLFNKDKTKLICYPRGKTETEYTIPDGVTSIGDYAFSGCSSLKNITIPDSVTSIGNNAFSNCSRLTSITIPDSVTSIGDYAFNSCTKLTSITIPDSVTSIGDSAFYYCSSLTSITIPEGVTSIGDSAFKRCTSLTSITLPDSVTSIGDSAFYNCRSLASITFGENSQLTSIGDSAFESCTSLTSITIPDSVTSIGRYAFDSCSSLESITFKSATTQIYDSADTIDSGATIYGYADSTAQAYATKYGRTFVEIGEEPGETQTLRLSVTKLGIVTPVLPEGKTTATVTIDGEVWTGGTITLATGKIYTISVTDGDSAIYTARVNLNIVDAYVNADTDELNRMIIKASALLGKVTGRSELTALVTSGSSLADGIFVSASAANTFDNAINIANACISGGVSQVEVDEATRALTAAYKSFVSAIRFNLILNDGTKAPLPTEFDTTVPDGETDDFGATVYTASVKYDGISYSFTQAYYAGTIGNFKASLSDFAENPDNENIKNELVALAENCNDTNDMAAAYVKAKALLSGGGSGIKDDNNLTVTTDGAVATFSVNGAATITVNGVEVTGGVFISAFGGDYTVKATFASGTPASIERDFSVTAEDAFFEVGTETISWNVPDCMTIENIYYTGSGETDNYKNYFTLTGKTSAAILGDTMHTFHIVAICNGQTKTFDMSIDVDTRKPVVVCFGDAVGVFCYGMDVEWIAYAESGSDILTYIPSGGAILSKNGEFKSGKTYTFYFETSGTNPAPITVTF